MDTKVCATCGEDKPLTEYSPHNGGLTGHCKTCMNAKYRERYKLRYKVSNKQHYTRKEPCIDPWELDLVTSYLPIVRRPKILQYK